MPEIIKAGGPVLYIIIICSVVALGFIIERFLTYHNSRCDMNIFFPPLENSIKLGKMEEATRYCEQSPGLIPRILLIGLRNKEENVEDIRRVLIDEIQINALSSLQKNLGILATIARAAPMLGLLGTVLGMIDMFANVGFGNAEEMAVGIRKALVTTAAGLIVAIPIIFSHAYLKAQIRTFERDIYHYLTRFLRIMRKRKEIA